MTVSERFTVAGASDDWYRQSKRAFAELRDEFDPGRSWTFSLETADGDPQQGDSQFDNDKANLAFMLRRIQILRFLTRRGNWGADSVQLGIGYLSDLCMFLNSLLESGRDIFPRSDTDVDGPLEVLNKFLESTKIFLSALVSEARQQA